MGKYDSRQAIEDATRSRAEFSGHGRAKGAKGYVSDTDDSSVDFLGTTGETTIFQPQEGGFGRIRIGAAWQPKRKPDESFFGKLLKRETDQFIDLDLACMYELADGTKGALQGFGNLFGKYDEAPYIKLSGDDRTGEDDDDIDGLDEFFLINGEKWPEIKRLLIYLYIYDGAAHWAEVAPQIRVEVPNEKPMIVTLHTYKSELCVCAVAHLENVRNGIKMTNITEYYPGHPSLDRAFGFGLEWEDGTKD